MPFHLSLSGYPPPTLRCNTSQPTLWARILGSADHVLYLETIRLNPEFAPICLSSYYKLFKDR